MRCQTVSKAKGKCKRTLNDIPREGSKIRAVYDLFQANKGRVIFINFNGVHPDQLTDYYGLDIRNMGYGKWVLAGEWFGKVYLDYISARFEEDMKNDLS